MKVRLQGTGASKLSQRRVKKLPIRSVLGSLKTSLEPSVVMTQCASVQDQQCPRYSQGRTSEYFMTSLYKMGDYTRKARVMAFI